MTIERRQASRRRDGEKMMRRCDDATMEGIQSSGRRGDVVYCFGFLDWRGTVRDFLRKNREGKRNGY